MASTVWRAGATETSLMRSATVFSRGHDRRLFGDITDTFGIGRVDAGTGRTRARWRSIGRSARCQSAAAGGHGLPARRRDGTTRRAQSVPPAAPRAIDAHALRAVMIAAPCALCSGSSWPS